MLAWVFLCTISSYRHGDQQFCLVAKRDRRELLQYSFSIGCSSFLLSQIPYDLSEIKWKRNSQRKFSQALCRAQMRFYSSLNLTLDDALYVYRVTDPTYSLAKWKQPH